jgi:hypothetical protein
LTQLALWEDPAPAAIAPAAAALPIIGGPFGGRFADAPDLHAHIWGRTALVDRTLPYDPTRPCRAVCQRERYVVTGDGPERRLVWPGSMA